MNIRIYQVNMKRDTNNVAFMRYELLEKLQGSQSVDSKIYDRFLTARWTVKPSKMCFRCLI